MYKSLLGALLIFAAATGVSADQTVGIAEKVSLQAAMQQHIDRSLVNGSYLHIDLKSGEVMPLHPVKAHPEILKMGEYYVLCADFRDDNGEWVNIDFYLARGERSYVVFHAAVNQQKLLKELMKAGKVQRIN